MGIRTPSFTTTKEQTHISHMGIKTPCYALQKNWNDLTEITAQSIHHFVLSL
jgi:hypothetical protein